MTTNIAHVQTDYELQRSSLAAEIARRNDSPNSWGVEAIDEKGDGEIYMAVFHGPSAKALAEEYARAKYASVVVR